MAFKADGEGIVLEQTIGVIGLGHVGLPLVGALAKAGYRVVGLDINESKVARLQEAYEPDIYEPGLPQLFQQYRTAISFTADYSYLMARCSSLIITINTPLQEEDKPNFPSLQNCISSIGERLRPGQLIILRSTVTPGTTREIAGRLEALSGLQAGSDFYIAYSPERVVEGQALEELATLPQIVSGIGKKSTRKAAQALGMLGGKVFEVSTPEVAELGKLVDNSYRFLNIAFANEVGAICQKIGIDSYEITQAVNESYDRTHLFLAGLGAGGPCLPKDSRILACYMNQLELDSHLIKAANKVKREATQRVVSIVAEYLKTTPIFAPRIAILGLAFKGFPVTDDIRGSPSIEIFEALKREFPHLQFQFHDPVVTSFLGSPVSHNLQECLSQSNIVLFLTNHPLLMSIKAEAILRWCARPLLVIDCWHNIQDPDKVLQDSIKIFRIGDGSL